MTTRILVAALALLPILTVACGGGGPTLQATMFQMQYASDEAGKALVTAQPFPAATDAAREILRLTDDLSFDRALEQRFRVRGNHGEFRARRAAFRDAVTGMIAAGEAQDLMAFGVGYRNARNACVSCHLAHRPGGAVLPR